eukprot:4280218-Pyramimonas_sp.AAC.1
MLDPELLLQPVMFVAFPLQLLDARLFPEVPVVLLTSVVPDSVAPLVVAVVVSDVVPHAVVIVGRRSRGVGRRACGRGIVGRRG